MTSAKLSIICVDEEKKESVEIRKRHLGEMKLIDWPKYSSVLSKRIDDAKRKQSIYSQISLNCYALGDSNTGKT